MKCYCDNCLLGKPEACETPKTLEEMKREVYEEWGEDDYDDTPRCPGYTTETVSESCGKELTFWEEGICPDCEYKRKRQEDLEDEMVERYHQRQLDMEEVYLMRQYEDDDGNVDGDREEDVTEEDVVTP